MRLHDNEDVTYLKETDLTGSLAEALSADVQRILADDGVSVAANTAVKSLYRRCTIF
jgi:hypothetical protein